MGTQHIARLCPIPNATRAQVEEWVTEMQADDEAEHGHDEGYSGYWNSCHGRVRFLSDIKASVPEAEEYLSKFTEKGNMTAIQVQVDEKDGQPFMQTPKHRELCDAIHAADSAFVAARRAALEARSKREGLVGCTHCGSKVAVRYTRAWHCPVCQQGELFGIFVADARKMDSAEMKFKAAQAKLKEAEKAYEAKRKVKAKGLFWLVLGACPS